MRRALKVGTFFNIPVYIHWTFVFILLFIGYVAFSNGYSLEESGWFFLIFASVFFCVILHEYGHALTARHFGIDTLDIILTPIGGVARLQGMPEKPWREFLVAIAGPLVNVAVALLLFPVIWFLYTDVGLKSLVGTEEKLVLNARSYLPVLVFLNLMLFVFNLIPAFPMDGGRILRALLSWRLKRTVATKIAVRIGQVLALGFIGFGIWNSSLSLTLIGFFVILTGQRELKAVEWTERMKTAVAQIMRREFVVLNDQQAVGTAFHIQANNSDITSFIVIGENNSIVGELKKDRLRSLRQEDVALEPVGSFIHPLRYSVEKGTPIGEALELMRSGQNTILPVTENGEIVAVVDYSAIRSVLNGKAY